MKSAVAHSRLKPLQEAYLFFCTLIWNQKPIELIVMGCVMMPMAFVLLGFGKLLSLIALPLSIGWGSFLIGTGLFKLILGLFRSNL